MSNFKAILGFLFILQKENKLAHVDQDYSFQLGRKGEKREIDFEQKHFKKYYIS